MVGQQIWESINDCFDAMPVAAVVDEKVPLSLKLIHFCNLLGLDILCPWWYSYALLWQRSHISY
jgi:hypothetical protein